MIKFVFGLASLRTLISFQRVVVACRHESRLQAPLLGLSLAQVGCSPLDGFITAPCSLGCLYYTPRPALSLTLWATNLLGEISFSFMYKIDSDIVFMCRTYTEIQVHRVFWCCCWSKLGLWVGRRLGWGGDRDTCIKCVHAFYATLQTNRNSVKPKTTGKNQSNIC